MVSSIQQHDLAIIIVSANDAEWLHQCLSSVLARREGISTDVVVVDNGCTDDTARVVKDRFPDVRLVRTTNRGFAAGNNRALPSCSARYVLFLNPDTEIRQGSFAQLLELMDVRPDVGVLGCRHLTPSGQIQQTIRRFPSPMRIWGEALGLQNLPFGLAQCGELVLDERRYQMERKCDWVAGSFMLVRAAAIAGAGYMDERFFLYSEETDFCSRVTGGGWKVLYSPRMEILHHAGKAGVDPRLRAQNTFARRQYARKHFGPVRKGLFDAGLVVYYTLRAMASLATPTMRRRHSAAVRCLRVSLGLEGSPFPATTPVAVDRVSWPREEAGTSRLPGKQGLVAQ